LPNFDFQSYSLIAFSTIVALFRFSARYILDVDCSIVLFASKLCDGTAFGANIRWRRKSPLALQFGIFKSVKSVFKALIVFREVN